LFLINLLSVKSKDGLTNVSLSFIFGADTWGVGNITTTSGTLVDLSGITGSRNLIFTGFGNGPISGSLALFNATNAVETELSFGITPLAGTYRTAPFTGFLGDYTATERASAVPVPATLGLLLIGLLGLPLSRQMRKKGESNLIQLI